MEKERLTLRQCQEDLNSLLQIDYASLSLPILAMALMSFGIFGLVWIIDFQEGAFWAAIPLIPLTVSVVQALGAVNRAKHLQSCTFEVVEDRLQSIAVNEEHRRLKQCAYTTMVYSLAFAGVGVHRIPNRPHYAWSHRYAMSADELYESVAPGDRFYVILLSDGEEKIPMLIYPTDRFEFVTDEAE